MTLPLSRNTNYAADSQVKSADLNKIQDTLVSLDTVHHRYTWLGAQGSTIASAATEQPTGVPGVAASSDHANAQVLSATAGLLSAGPALPASSPFPALVLFFADAAVNQAAIVHTHQPAAQSWIASDLDDCAIVMEWRFALQSVGGNGVDLYIGLSEDPDDNAASIDESHAHILVRKRSGDTNWQLTAGDGANETLVDTGVPPVAATWQKMRLEVHGKNTPDSGGTHNLVRLFIDGSLAAEIEDANVPNGVGGAFGLGFVAHGRANGTGPSGTFRAFLSPVNINIHPFL